MDSLPATVDSTQILDGISLQPSRRGPLILSFLENSIQEISRIDYRQLNVQVPDWFTKFQEEHPVLSDSVALAVAEQFYLRERYLGCRTWLDAIQSQDVFSPALRTYLIATSNYLLVEYEEASKAIDSTDFSDDKVRVALGESRQQTLAQLARILGADQKEVAQISRRMFDIERRLAIGQSELPTIQQQQRVIDDLDKLIEKLEQQQQQQQQAGASGGSPSGTPAEDSVPAEQKGPGDVDRKRFASGDPWGQLSPAERDRLSQSIDRDFPAHYRNLIESYYRRLAEGEEKYSESPGGSP